MRFIQKIIRNGINVNSDIEKELKVLKIVLHAQISAYITQ